MALNTKPQPNCMQSDAEPTLTSASPDLPSQPKTVPDALSAAQPHEGRVVRVFTKEDLEKSLAQALKEIETYRSSKRKKGPRERKFRYFPPLTGMTAYGAPPKPGLEAEVIISRRKK